MSSRESHVDTGDGAGVEAVTSVGPDVRGDTVEDAAVGPAGTVGLAVAGSTHPGTTETGLSTARAADGDGAVGFAADLKPPGVADVVRGYLARLRAGQVGSLPALLGLGVMLVAFGIASRVFLTTGNLANLPAQAAPTALIAMGLVFVLLLGEIDLSAGTASGVCAAAMALAVNNTGDLRQVLGTGTFWTVVALMLAALGVAVLSRLWWAAAIVTAGVVVTVTTSAAHVLVAIFLAMATGTAIGLLTGFLVARVGIPSFVVTLALFLAWQGVLLKFIGLGNAIPVRDFAFINGLANRNMAPVHGWLTLGVFVVGYAVYTLTRSLRRRASSLSADPVALVLARVVVAAVVGGVVLYLLNQERSPNPAFTSVKGVPYVVPLIGVLMVFWTLVLSKTSFGRHVYAVGGNTEAARRAGIDVTRVRIAAFTICSTMAALGGVALASKIGGVPADAGGGNQLLYAVGAAVIGGTSLFGGRGRVRDAVLGAVVIAMIPNGLGLLPNLGSSYDFMITGMVLLLAASIDALTRKRATVSGAR